MHNSSILGLPHSRHVAKQGDDGPVLNTAMAPDVPGSKEVHRQTSPHGTTQVAPVRNTAGESCKEHIERHDLPQPRHVVTGERDESARAGKSVCFGGGGRGRGECFHRQGLGLRL